MFSEHNVEEPKYVWKPCNIVSESVPESHLHGVELSRGFRRGQLISNSSFHLN